MKAFLLAAGLGTRLKPITDTIPKCLVNICDAPMLSWWIKLFEKHGINEVLINLHHHSEKVISFLNSYQTKVRFELFYEDKLLGSAGTLRENKNFVRNDRHFFICYADNLTNYNLTEFLKFHISKRSLFSMALFRAEKPEEKGIALLNKNNLIIGFEEKPKQPKSNLANAGIYISSTEILDMIPNNEITDIGYHLLPKLIGKMNGWESNDYLIDIGITSDLAKAEVEWKTRLNGDNNDV